MKVCPTYDIFGQKERDFVVVFLSDGQVPPDLGKHIFFN